MERKGCRIDDDAVLDKLREELAHMRQDFDNRWPWINESIIAEARADHARGDYQTVEEILRELQGPNPQRHPA